MANSKVLFLLLIILSAISGCHNDRAEEAPAAYFPRVKLIIQNNCIACHSVGGTGTPKGFPTVLETDDEIVNAAGAIKAATIDPVTFTNKRMPYGGELSDADKNVILNWYNRGGKTTD